MTKQYVERHKSRFTADEAIMLSLNINLNVCMLNLAITYFSGKLYAWSFMHHENKTFIMIHFYAIVRDRPNPRQVSEAPTLNPIF